MFYVILRARVVFILKTTLTILVIDENMFRLVQFRVVVSLR